MTKAFTYEEAVTPATGAFSYEDATPAQPASAARKLGDLGLSVAKGVVAVPEAAVGLADLVTGGKAGKLVEQAGVRFKDAKDVLTSFQSDDLAGKRAQFDQADGVMGKAMTAITNPSLITNTVAESLPLMGAGAVPARMILGAMPGAGMAAGAIGEGVVGAGSAAESIRQQTADGELTAKQALMGGATGLAAAGFGYGGARAAKALGVGDFDTMAATGARQVLTERAKPKGVERRIAEGAASEAFLEELPQSLSEQALQNVALDRPVTEDLDAAAVMGTLAGGAMGGVAGAISKPVLPPPVTIDPTGGPTQRAVALLAAVSPLDPTKPAGPLTRAANVAAATTLTGQTGADLPAIPDNPLLAGARVREEDRRQENLTDKAMAALERMATDDLQAMNAARFEGQRRAAPAAQTPGAGQAQTPPAASKAPAPARGDATGAAAEPAAAGPAAVEAAGVEGAIANPPKKMVEESQQEKVEKEWTANYDRVSTTDDLANVPIKDLERADSWAQARKAREQRKGWDGGEVNQNLVSALQSEQDRIRAELKKRNGATEAAPNAPTPKTGDTITVDAKPADTQRITTDKAEMRPYRKPDGSVGYEAVPIVEAAPAGVVKVPKAVDDALTADMSKQQARMKRLRSAAEADGQSLEEKKAALLKATAAEAALRRMRTTRFDAEDAAVAAVAAGDLAPFAVHADIFPSAAQALGVFMGKNDELDAEMQAPAASDAVLDGWWGNGGISKDGRNLTAVGRTEALAAIGYNAPMTGAKLRWAYLPEQAREKLAAMHAQGWEPAAAPAPTAASAAPVSRNAVAARDLLAEYTKAVRDGEGQKALAAIKKRAQTLASNTPATDEAAVLALDMLATRMDTESFAFADAPAPQQAPAPAPKPDPLTEQEKAAKAKMLGAAAKLATLLSKNTRANITPEQEQQMLPIVIDLFEGAMELGYVKFKQAARYVREFIAQAIDQDAADSIPIDTLQGAYIATARRHADKEITPKKDVIAVETIADLEEEAPPAEPPKVEKPADNADTDEKKESLFGANDDARRNAADDSEPLDETLPGPSQGDGAGGSLEAGDGLRPADAQGNGRPEGDRPGRGNGLDGGSEPVLPGSPAEIRPLADGPLGNTEDRPRPLAGENPGNFVITDDFNLGSGTDGDKIEGNLRALRTLRKVQSEHRYPTRDEQAIMARYVGWGGLKTVFDPKKEGASDQYGRAQAELKRLLSPAEYRAANGSIRNAHYTAEGIVDGMWRVVRHMGFKGGRALEPTLGIGNFVGRQPADMAASTEWHASELDAVTGQMAAMLYPEANVLAATGFQDAPFADESFDISVGNPPFGQQPIDDKNPRRKHLSGMKIHNYIIAKTGMHLRPGGVMSMVVTHRFLDTANPEARDVLAKDFRFLGAFRLPNDAFKSNAGTEVVTDVVFLQKLRPDEARERDASWLDINGKIEVDGQSIRVNRYYQDHPDHILGRSAMDGTMYAGRKNEDGSGEYTVHSDGRDLGQAIDELITTGFADLAGVLAKTNSDLAAAPAMLTQSDIPVGGVMLSDDGRIIRRELDDGFGNAVLQEITPETLWKEQAAEWKTLNEAVLDVKKAAANGAVTADDAAEVLALSKFLYRTDGTQKDKPSKAVAAVYQLVDDLATPGKFQWSHDDALALLASALQRKQLGQKGHESLKAMLDLRNRTLALIRAEQSDAPGMEGLRTNLNKAYEAFVRAHGFLSDPDNANLLEGDVGAEAGLEASYVPEISPAVAKSSGMPVRKAEAKKADILSTRVNYPYKEITKADSPADALFASLSEHGKVDLPYMARITGKSVAEVIQELTAGDNPQLFRDPESGEYQEAERYLSGNVKHKLAVARERGMQANVKALTAAQPAPKTRAQVKPNIRGMWMPTEIFKEFLEAIGYANPVVTAIQSQGILTGSGETVTLTDLGTQFRHGKRTPMDMFNSAASGKPIKITVRSSDGRTLTDEQGTKEVNALTERMAKVFQDWAYSDDSRAERIVAAFNENMNTHTPRSYDGVKYLKPVGASPSVILRRTQKDAGWRMMQEQTILLDHVVGAGKTFTLITGIMERRRMGLSRKPMVMVPNHLVTQWARDFYKLYPGAKVLAANPADFARKNRRRLLARIATGDYDAVIVGHTSVGFMETPTEDLNAIITEKLAGLKEALAQARLSKESKRTLGQIEDRIDRYEKKLKDLADRAVDDIGIDFRALGVDYLAVDEAHEFKNLEYSTSGDRVVGMNDPNGSKKAFDLYGKVRGLLERGGGVAFATGTPVSNSLVEIYTVMSYLAHDELKLRGQEHFDSWSGAYAATETRLEYTATQKLKPRRVLAGLNNLSALRQLYEQFADIITMRDLKRIYTEEMEAKNAKRAEIRKLPVVEQDAALASAKLKGLDDERTDFPVPKVMGSKRQLIPGDITLAQREYMDYLVARMGAIERNKSDREYARIDNPLNVLTDARKMSLDIRIVDPGAPRDENGKVATAVKNIKENYDKWMDDRGTQLVFCDLSTPAKTAQKEAGRIISETLEKLFGKKDAKRAKQQLAGMPYEEQWQYLVEKAEEIADSETLSEERRDEIATFMAAIEDPEATMNVADIGFSVYDDMRELLIKSGIPESEIAFIHDYNTPDQKERLFDRVNNGYVRVLLGSSAKMGAGTNAQRRLVALHHMDAPWRPSDVEQREGRIIRQGNMLYERDPDGFEVDIKAYSTNNTSDTVMWQILQRKAGAIEQFREGGIDSVEEEGGDSDQYAEFMATSTGNPVFRQKLEAERRLTELEAEIGGSLITRSNATSFLESYARRRADAVKRAEAGQTFDYSSASYGGESGTAAEFMAAMAAANRVYLEKYAAWTVKQAAAELAVKTWELEPESTRGDKPSMPTMPSQPSMKTKEVRDASGYARAMVLALSEAKSDKSVMITMGDGAKIQIEGGKLKDTIVWTVDAMRAGVRIRLAYSSAESALASSRLTDALTPDSMKMEMESEARTETSRVKELDRQKVSSDKGAALDVDTRARDRAREELNWLKAQVSFAEMQTDIERSKRPNRFIARDKRRNLGQTKAVAVKPPERLKIDGKTYTTTGIEGRVEWQAVREANRVSDGLPVLVMNKFEGTGSNAKLVGYTVIEQPKSMRAKDKPTNTRQTGAPEGNETDVVFMRGTPQTETKAFKDWFGDSKVVDAEGKPLVVYHGTPNNFNVFLGRHRNSAQFSAEIGATWFTPDEAMARGYSGGKEPMAVYLSMQNPYIHDADGGFWMFENDRAIKAARAGGHDGVIIKNVSDTSAGQSDRLITTYVTFSPTQIKSATGNRGTFDPKDPDIRFLRGDPAPRGAKVVAVQQFMDSITEKWSNAPTVIVAANMDDPLVPKAVRDYNASQMAKDAAGAPMGFFYGGKVYVLAESLNSPQDALTVLAHEALGHYGLRGMFGDRLDGIKGQIIAMRKKEVLAKANVYRLPVTPEAVTEALVAKGIAKPTQEQIQKEIRNNLMYAAEEVLAEMAQTVPSLGFVKRAVAIVRQWLRENIPGFGKMELTDDEIINQYIVPARGWVVRGRESGVAEPTLAFMRNQKPGAWRSELFDKLAAAKMESSREEGWRAFIQGLTTKGVKPDEIEWSGVTDWLKMQPGKVTKQQVLAYLDANGVQVQEVVLGAQSNAEADKAMEKWGIVVSRNPEDENQVAFLDRDNPDDLMTADELESAGYPIAAVRAAMEIESGGVAVGATGFPKYSQYTLPGGQNYREVLLTLPVAPVSTEGWTATVGSKGASADIYRVNDRNGEYVDNPIARTPEEAIQKAAMTAGNKRHREAYKSSHWDEKNILAHIRLNDRTDADGNRVLFVEEIQSDWGQEGKKKGFKSDSDIKPVTSKQMDAFIDKMLDKFIAKRVAEGADKASAERLGINMAFPDMAAELGMSDEYARMRAGRTMEASGEDANKPPLAPFVTSTDKWLSLALKRVITMAAQEGYDKVAFVNGEQSAERYDLSKQISEVYYDDNGSGGIGDAKIDGEPTAGTLYALDLNGKRVVDQYIEPSELENYVGKDVARKLLEQAPSKARVAGIGYRRRKLSGLDLKVGGEGMKAFYDKIVPIAANKLLAKLGGGKLETVELQIPGQKAGATDSNTGAVIGPNGTAGQNLDATGFTITPAMREKAGQGLPMFSRGAAGNVLNGLKAMSVTDVKKRAGNSLADYRGLGLQLLGRRQLVDLYSKELPALIAYNELVQQMEADKNETGAQADEIASRWAKVKDDRQLAELMHDATVAQIDPSKAYVTGDNRIQYGALRARWDALSEDARAVYLEARDAYKEHYSRVREEIRNRIERSGMSATAQGRMLARMDDEFFKKIKGVYFPLARFGKYVVVTRDNTGTVINVGRAETLNEAKALRTELLNAYPAARGFTVGKVIKDKEFNAARDAVGRGFLKQLFGVLDQEGVGAELQDAVNQLYLQSMPDLSWAKHGIHRKGTPGFSQDARRAFAQNMFHGARYLAKLRYADQLQDQLNDMQEHVQSKATDATYDSVKGQQVVDEMVARHDSLMNPKTNALSTALTSLGFVFHLGLSPASAMVNLSQTALVAYPVMAAKWGYDKAGAALLRASREAAVNGNDISKVLTGDERRAYDEAVRAGTIDVTMAHDLAGIAQGEDSRVTWKLRPVMKAASFLFHHAERFNRQVTFVAAYRLARAAGSDHGGAFAQATRATYDGHYDYSAANRPRLMQGNIAKVVLLFKQYGQNMVYTLARHAMQSMNGLTAKERSEARRALAGLLVMHAAAAGVLGLPMVTTLLAAASMIGGSDDEPWDAETALRNMLADAFGQKPAEVLARGVSRLTPWDISGRVGLDKLILPDIQEGLEGQRLGESALTALAGPVAGIGISALKGLQEISEGAFARGLETMMPSALRGPLRSYRYWDEGAQDRTGVSIVEEVSAAGIAGQALGLAPSEVRLATEAKSAVLSADKRLAERRGSLLAQYARAVLQGEDTADALAEIDAFNTANPGRRIAAMHLQASVRARRRRIDGAEQGVYLPRNRREAMEDGRFGRLD